MNRSFYFLSVLFIFTAGVCIEAQPHPTNTGMMPGLRRQSLVLDINARVLEKEEVIWDESHQKITIPGSPVVIRLVGSNIVVVVQFTPFISRHGNVMAAQGQIWINDSERGISYYTSIQTIPMEFNEPIYFFPLGTSPQLNSSIEIRLTVNPYREPALTENEE
jgi:hypothetical protein